MSAGPSAPVYLFPLRVRVDLTRRGSAGRLFQWKETFVRVLAFTFASKVLEALGAKHCKHADRAHRDLENKTDHNGNAPALGALLDSIPESIVMASASFAAAR